MKRLRKKLRIVKLGKLIKESGRKIDKTKTEQ